MFNFDLVKILKHIISLLLALILFVSVSGVNVYKHYCGDFIREISIYIQSNPCSDEGGEDVCSMGKKASCCDDEVEYHQLDITLQQGQIQKIEFDINHQIVELFAQLPLTTKSESQLDFRIERPPPDLVKIPLFKTLNQYLFYG